VAIFGDRIKQLREQKGLIQRQVANHLDMDTPMLSKIERGERKARRDEVAMFSNVLNVPVESLLSLWLADKVYDLVKDEDVALDALSVTKVELNNKNQKK